MNKKIFMIAGPNEAGKTTTAMTFFSNIDLVFGIIKSHKSLFASL
jgi:uncharacterized protein YhaN